MNFPSAVISPRISPSETPFNRVVLWATIFGLVNALQWFWAWYWIEYLSKPEERNFLFAAPSVVGSLLISIPLSIEWMKTYRYSDVGRFRVYFEAWGLYGAVVATRAMMLAFETLWLFFLVGSAVFALRVRR